MTHAGHWEMMVGGGALALQLAIYLALNIWTYRSYMGIPARMHEHSANALIAMPDVKLFVGFIRACGWHHLAHAVLMTGLHVKMLPHMIMSWGDIIFYCAVWVVLIFTDYKMAAVSHRAWRDLRLE